MKATKLILITLILTAIYVGGFVVLFNQDTVVMHKALIDYSVNLFTFNQ